MPDELKNGSKVVGAKQTKRAVGDGRAKRVYLASDADPRVTGPIAEVCAQHGVPTETACSMKELGAACGISVGAAVAALLN